MAIIERQAQQQQTTMNLPFGSFDEPLNARNSNAPVDGSPSSPSRTELLELPSLMQRKQAFNRAVHESKKSKSQTPVFKVKEGFFKSYNGHAQTTPIQHKQQHKEAPRRLENPQSGEESDVEAAMSSSSKTKARQKTKRTKEKASQNNNEDDPNNDARAETTKKRRTSKSLMKRINSAERKTKKTKSKDSNNTLATDVHASSSSSLGMSFSSSNFVVESFQDEPEPTKPKSPKTKTSKKKSKKKKLKTPTKAKSSITKRNKKTSRKKPKQSSVSQTEEGEPKLVPLSSLSKRPIRKKSVSFKLENNESFSFQSDDEDDLDNDDDDENEPLVNTSDHYHPFQTQAEQDEVMGQALLSPSSTSSSYALEDDKDNNRKRGGVEDDETWIWNHQNHMSGRLEYDEEMALPLAQNKETTTKKKKIKKKDTATTPKKKKESNKTKISHGTTNSAKEVKKKKKTAASNAKQNTRSSTKVSAMSRAKTKIRKLGDEHHKPSMDVKRWALDFTTSVLLATTLTMAGAFVAGFFVYPILFA